MKNFLKEFKDFIVKGDMISLAIGVLVANAFTALIGSFTTNILTPLLGIFGSGDTQFKDMKFSILNAEFLYGEFINAIISFLITGFILFLIMRTYNRMKEASKKEEEAVAAGPTVEELLIEIRDELKKQ